MNDIDKAAVSRMKKGDYRVHVYFEQARYIMPAGDKDLSDPVFMVTVFNSTKSTKPFTNKSVNSIIPIGEHLFIEALQKLPDEVKSERIHIEVRDHNTFSRDQPLGTFDFDLGFIYGSSNHSVRHQWIVLCLPNDVKYFEPKGYLKVSISVTHEDDQGIDLCAETADSLDESAILPTFIKPKLEQVVVQLIKAESLPIMDLGGTLDVYCTASLSGYECRSSVIAADKGTLSAMWCEELLLPCLVPTVSNTLKLTFMDSDAMNKDDYIGSIDLNLQEIREGHYKNFFWRNIYGAPPLSDSEAALLMNKVPEIASHWRGRVLMRVWIDENIKEVQKKLQKIQEKNIEQKIQEDFETGQMYEIRAQVISAVELPFKKESYKIKIEWSGVETVTTEKSTENGCVDWYETVKRKVAQIPQGATELMPDVIVYLTKGDEKICYTRVPASECFDMNKEPGWINFKPELHSGKVKDAWQAGFIKLKLYIGVYIEGKEDPKWKPKKIPDTQQWTLYAHIFQCRNLLAADKNGLADPYLRINFSGSEITTKSAPCDMTLNPKWYETFNTTVTMGPPSEIPPLILSLYDYDHFGEDDFMGAVQIDEIESDPETAPKPKWLKLTFGDKLTKCGEILASFSLSHKVDVKKKFLIMPKFVDKVIDINVLGMRDLKPALGWLPVNKAFLRFDLNSLELPGSAITAKSVETQPFEEGTDPNIMTIISAGCKMPLDPLYASNFTVTVHDSILSGASQPLIGSFSINLSKYFYPKSSFLSFAEALVRSRKVINFKRILRKCSKGELKVKETKELKVEKMNFFEVCGEPSRLVVMPSFKPSEKGIMKEVNIPDSELYMPLGYNREPEDGKKQYRYKLDSGLESTHIFSTLPFDEFPIYRAVFNDLRASGIESPPTIQEVGKFKANIRIRDPGQSTDDQFDEIRKMLLKKQNCIVRVYILDAYEIEQKDSNSLSDPYVRLKIGSNIVTDKDNHQTDVTDPKIFKVFDIHTTFPGKSILKVQMWDYNQYSTDTKIGTTRIDLENRFFNNEWHNIQYKPIETRPLLLKSSRRPQGYIRLWVEIWNEGQIPPRIDISLKPPMNYELRLVVWKSENVPSEDAKDPGDLYVKAKVNNLGEKRTDTHYKVQNGQAVWNWRMKFQVNLPNKLENVINLQIWDKDFLSSNDFISECSFSFQREALQVYEDNVSVRCNIRSAKPVDAEMAALGAFWLESKTKNGGPGGFLLVSMDLIPEHIAKRNPVGDERKEPNNSPVLPKPSGRFKFSYNPITLLGQVVGPEINKKVCGLICLGIIVLVLIFCIPIFLLNGASSIAFN